MRNPTPEDLDDAARTWHLGHGQRGGEGLPLAEYARRCRETCGKGASAGDGRKCGESRELDGETVFSFCGRHWGPVLDAY